MVLLKSFLSSSEQADILIIGHTHGLGSAGFYQPQFREGGKLHLKMMCFGEFWDPETSKYGEFQPMDHAKPPSVPPEFLLFVDKAMKISHSLIVEHHKEKKCRSCPSPSQSRYLPCVFVFRLFYDHCFGSVMLLDCL